mgnify:FL=1
MAERSLVMRLSLDRARRSVLSGALGSPLLRWRYGAPVADELLIVPQDLRAADPSFASELEFGHFGLAGAVALLGYRSPFVLEPPSQAWARELHGFDWLRHLRAAGHAKARDYALAYVADWIKLRTLRRGVGAEPAVAARRLIAWISNAALLLEGVDKSTYGRTTDSLGDQLRQLSASWRAAPEGYPRLLALIGVVYGDLCVAGHDRHLSVIEQAFADELGQQILPDGGHISRNPAVPVELLVDLLPLRQCYSARQRKPPAALGTAIERMMRMLRYLQLGNGGLSRFNGVGAQVVDPLATVLAYDPEPEREFETAAQSRYMRLQRGDSIVIIDVGAPPPLSLSAEAHAGALSFEISSGACPILVNCGAPGPADQSWRPASRATASHNALSIAGRSSSRLVRNEMLEALLAGTPIRSPDTVTARLGETGDAIEVEASHDGYLERHGLLHLRSLKLAADGLVLDGTDQLKSPHGQMRLKQDLPIAVHFHAHPDVAVAVADDRMSATLKLRNGERWRFSAVGAPLSLEESIHFADITGPRQALQLVLRASCYGETAITWRLERVEAGRRSR